MKHCEALLAAVNAGRFVPVGPADLEHIKKDFYALLARAGEVESLRQALLDGRVDGATPYAYRPAELWFQAIFPGDTPDNSAVVELTVKWIDEFLATQKEETC